MFIINYFAVVIFICVAGLADGMIDDYRYLTEINGFLKLHRVPAKWQDARLRCHLEGGELTSPIDENISAAMKEMLTKDNQKVSPNRVYTGIHATYSDGDFTTITGIPLSQIDVQWAQGEPDDTAGKKNCISMFQTGELAFVDCATAYPYFCFKSIEKMDVHKCGPEYNNSDYKLEHRTGSCYKFHAEGRSWPNAFKTCMAEEAHLAIINSKLESDVLRELYSKYPGSAIPGNFEKDATSIGFSMWKEIGDWYTIHGESLAEAGFTTFNAGEPNNANGNEWCGSILRTGLMNDGNCDIRLTFICEKSPSQENEEVHYQSKQSVTNNNV